MVVELPCTSQGCVEIFVPIMVCIVRAEKYVVPYMHFDMRSHSSTVARKLCQIVNVHGVVWSRITCPTNVNPLTPFVRAMLYTR